MGLGKKAKFKMRGWVMMIMEKVWKMIKEGMLPTRKSSSGIKRQAQRQGKDRGILREYGEKRLVTKSEIADH